MGKVVGYRSICLLTVKIFKKKTYTKFPQIKINILSVNVKYKTFCNVRDVSTHCESISPDEERMKKCENKLVLPPR